MATLPNQHLGSFIDGAEAVLGVTDEVLAEIIAVAPTVIADIRDGGRVKLATIFAVIFAINRALMAYQRQQDPAVAAQSKKTRKSP